MAANTIKLSAFLAIAQHEVQQTLEYLAHPDVRRQDQGAPSQVLATIGNVKLSIPLQVALVQSPHLGGSRPPGAPPAAGEILLPGAPWPPGSKMRYQLNVATPQGCTETTFACAPLGTLQIEFITVLKQ
jgi:hypothetical protein